MYFSEKTASRSWNLSSKEAFGWCWKIPVPSVFLGSLLILTARCVHEIVWFHKLFTEFMIFYARGQSYVIEVDDMPRHGFKKDR